MTSPTRDVFQLELEKRNVVQAEIDPLTGGIEIAKVVKGKSAAQLATSPSAADIALGDSTEFYDIADPTKRYAMNAGHTAFVSIGGSAPVNSTSTQTFTGTLTNNSAVLSAVSDFSNIAVGLSITGTGVESGAVVSAFNSAAQTITLSKVCKGTTASGRIFSVEKPGPNGLLASTPAPSKGLVVSDSGWDYPYGYAPLFNYRPRQVRKFLAAIGAATAGKYGGYNTTSIGTPGVYSSNVLVFGDSKVIGNTPVSPNPPKRKHAPYYIATQLIAAMGGINAKYASGFFIYTSTVADFMAYDQRFNIGSGWYLSNNNPSVYANLRNDTTTAPMVFTPEESCDGFDIYIRWDSAAGTTVSWAIDGGAATNIVSGATDNGKLMKYSVSAGSLGAHALSIARVSNTASIVGIVPTDSTYYGLNIVNLGISGASLQQRAGYSSDVNSGVPKIASLFNPALVIHQWGYTDIGDSNTPLTSVSDTIAAYTTEVAYWKAAGVPVVIVTPSPWDDVNLYRDDASQRDYLRALRAFCIAQDLPMINMDDRWGSWQEASGFVTHYARPDPAGNSDMGRTIAKALLMM